MAAADDATVAGNDDEATVVAEEVEVDVNHVVAITSSTAAAGVASTERKGVTEGGVGAGIGAMVGAGSPHTLVLPFARVRGTRRRVTFNTVSPQDAAQAPMPEPKPRPPRRKSATGVAAAVAATKGTRHHSVQTVKMATKRASLAGDANDGVSHSAHTCSHHKCQLVVVAAFRLCKTLQLFAT